MVNFYGLYIGNSTFSIATYRDDGKVEILANEAGDRITPAVVTISHEEQVVGSAASCTSYSLASLTIRNNKTLLDKGLSEEALSRAIARSLVKIEQSDDGQLIYTIYKSESKPLTITPTQVATRIFTELHRIAIGASPGDNNVSCVLCVPRHWSEESRKNFADAATTAGWKVMQVINQSPSALLAYRIGFEKPPIDLTALVYRLGGVSCDVSIIKIENGLHSTISYIYTDKIGGKDIIAALQGHLTEEIRRKYHLDPKENRKSMWKLSCAAKDILHTLSTLTSCSRFLESVCEGLDTNVTVSKARLDSLIAPLLQAFTQPIYDALTEANLQASDISKVVVCGGAMNVIRLKDHISKLFNCEVLSNLRPDEVLACGAAQQAGLLGTINQDLPPFEAVKELPILAAQVEVKIGDISEVIMEKSVLPISRQTSLNTGGILEIYARQEINSEHFLQGEAKIELNEEPQEYEIHLKLTTQNELLIETVSTITKEVMKAAITFNM